MVKIIFDYLPKIAKKKIDRKRPIVIVFLLFFARIAKNGRTKLEIFITFIEI